MAKVDILLPYWGDLNLLKQTLDSILAQTYDDWRLVIADDCYPSEEAKSYLTGIQDPRIHYIRHEKNMGITKNFNFLLSKVTAPYCIMVGCDDLLLPKYLETALANINECSFYQPGVQVINEVGDIYFPLSDKIKHLLRPSPGIHSGQRLASSLCTGNWLYFPSIMWRSSVITAYGFDEKYLIAEDLKLELSIIARGGSLFVDSEKTFQYRRFKNSLSGKERNRGGLQFKEEREVYKYFSQVFWKRRWYIASFLAKLRLTARLHKTLATLTSQ